MKYFIASDIHGSEYYCRKMLESYEAEKADKLVLLGDILYHGPRNDLPKDYAPKKVIDLLNPLSNEILAVRGNCDTEVDQMVLSFPILADYAIISEGRRMIYLTHGHNFNEKKTDVFHLIQFDHFTFQCPKQQNNAVNTRRNGKGNHAIENFSDKR